VELDV